MQLIIIIFSIVSFLIPPTLPHHFLPHSKPFHHLNKPQESLQLTPPLSTSTLPLPPPHCTLSLLRHSFATTYGRPPITTPYSPPSDCPPPWSHLILHLSAAVSGEQYDRVAAVWFSGVELLRTTTPEPFGSGTFWNVRKDVTRYSSLFLTSNASLSMMLENVVNDVFTGVIHVNLTLLFYKDGVFGGVLGFGFADLVIPVCANGNEGFWFRIEDESNLGSKNVVIPSNSKRILLELYVSFHGDDEFWYSNPPNRYIEANNLTTGRGNGAFREVFVRIDGNYVASQVPIPVVFTGGVNPLFWEPVVGIGVFDLPSYDIELTPFLGSLLDGRSHSFELGVAHGIGLWLVDANLHVWLDKESSMVEAKMGFYEPPEFVESWVYDFNELDGLFEVEARRSSQSSGWVADSSGNLTMITAREIRLTNSITFQRNGTHKLVRQKLKVKTEVRVLSDMGMLVSRRKFRGKYPLDLFMSTVPISENGTSMMKTRISFALKEKTVNGRLFSSISNSQESRGWMLVKDHDVLTGEAETKQTLKCWGHTGCFSQSVEANGGRLLSDNSTTVCPPVFRYERNVMYGDL